MIYIDKNYLATHIQDRLIDESTQNDDSILDAIELSQIEIIKTYLGSRYNVESIFGSQPIANEVLKEILSKLMLYKLVKRNAARKVPTDFKEQYDEAMKQLKEIATGVIVLSELPNANGETGTANSNTLTGNLINKNFYI